MSKSKNEKLTIVKEELICKKKENHWRIERVVSASTSRINLLTTKRYFCGLNLIVHVILKKNKLEIKRVSGEVEK